MKILDSTKKTNDEMGFTLVELLIIMVLAGIVLAFVVIGLPSYSNNTKNLQIKSTMNELESLALRNNRITSDFYDKLYAETDKAYDGLPPFPGRVGVIETGSPWEGIGVGEYCCRAVLIKNNAYDNIYWCFDSKGNSGTTTVDFCSADTGKFTCK